MEPHSKEPRPARLIARGDKHCPFCREHINPKVSTHYLCPSCQTEYHRPCARELGGCGTLGCDKRGQFVQAVRPVSELKSNKARSDREPLPLTGIANNNNILIGGVVIVGLLLSAFTFMVFLGLQQVLGGSSQYSLGKAKQRRAPRRRRGQPRRPKRPRNRLQIQAVSLRSAHPKTPKLTLPTGQASVINVFLQGCQDCMPAFRKYRDMDGFGQDIPVINVAYGRASLSWCQSYGVAEKLYIDPGNAIVRPVGISTFTTLVVDAEGRIRSMHRPTDPAYREKVLESYQKITAAKAPKALKAPTQSAGAQAQGQ